MDGWLDWWMKIWGGWMVKIGGWKDEVDGWINGWLVGFIDGKIE
jgi:hypothetical protein